MQSKLNTPLYQWLKTLLIYRGSDYFNLLALTLVYAVFARLVLTFSTANGNVTIFWIPGGFALYALLIGGKKLWPGIFLGAFLAGLMVSDPWQVSIFLALGNTLETLIATVLLQRIFKFNSDLTTIDDFLTLAVVAILSASISAIIGPATLLIYGYLTLQSVGNNIWHWWQADALGILLGTPLFLVWQKWPDYWFQPPRILKTLIFFLLAFLTGQVVFLDWFNAFFGFLANSYWMFLFVVLAAVYFGRHGVLLILSMVSIQALLGAVEGIGFFGQDLAQTGLQQFWLYILILTVVGITLAVISKQRNYINLMLEESRNRFFSIIQQSPFSTQVFAADGSTILVNSAWEKLWNARAEVIMGYNVLDDQQIIDKGIMPFIQQGFAGEASEIPAIIYNPAENQQYPGPQNSRWIRSFIYPIKLPTGKIGEVILIHEDISERYLALRALAESEQRFRNLSDLLPEQIWTATPDGLLNYVNQRVLDFFNSSIDAMLHDNWQSVVHPEDLPRTLQQWTKALQTGVPYECEFRLRHFSGEYRWCVAKALPERDEAGQIIKWYGVNNDIHERKQSENALRESESRFRDLTTIAPVIIFRTDASGKCVFINEAWKDLTGFPLDSTLGVHWAHCLYAEDRQRVLQEWETAFTAGREFSSEYRVNTHSGQIKHVLGRAISNFSEKGELLGYVGTLTDITERKQFEEKLRLTAKIFESTLEGIIITNAEFEIIEVNEAFSKITEYSRAEVIGLNPRILKSGHHDAAFYSAMWNAISTTGHWAGEVWNRRKYGEVYPEWITISAISNESGSITHYVGISSDITLLKQHEKQLEHIAHYDALTGIPNRMLLVDRMQQALAQTKREKKLVAICYLDLDGFKPINDSHGHEAGDKVLIKTAARISQNLRGGDTVARLGGDEFVILLLGIENHESCYASIDRILEAIEQPISINSIIFRVTASIGVSLYPLDDHDPDTLLRHADQAMYFAKQSGKNRYHIFDPQQDSRIRLNREFRERVAQGLKAQEFELFYQPKVNMIDHRIVGAEALIRWQHPERGLLPPIEFLPMIENSELEIDMGEWVIETALTQLELWQQHGIQLEISINIAAQHLQSPNFTAQLAAKLAQHASIAPQLLQIEILETAALADISRVSKIIEDCIAIGVNFALDDFGTGYSSLAYLRKLPANTLKIDQSFVRDMLSDSGDFAIVRGIIALAETFHRTTVAEGVETQEHFEALLQLGCDIGQGYGIARPMPASAFVNWYHQNQHLAEKIATQQKPDH